MSASSVEAKRVPYLKILLTAIKEMSTETLETTEDTLPDHILLGGAKV